MLTRFLTKSLVTAVAAVAAAYLLNGVHIDGIQTAIVLALVLALLNTFIRPILVILTLPITIVTLGLFLLIINILIIKLASNLVTGFTVDNWWAALLFSLLVSLGTTIMEKLVGNKK